MRKLLLIGVTIFVMVFLMGCKPGIYYPRPNTDTSTTAHNETGSAAKTANGSRQLSSPFR